MGNIDHERLLRLLSRETNAWFGGQIRQLAIQHDIGGPQIQHVPIQKYTSRLMAEFATLVQIARSDQSLVFPKQHLDDYYKLAACEVVRIRQIQRAHATGQLSTQDLKQLPIYSVYRDYFDQHPELLMDGFYAALEQREHPWQAAVGGTQTQGSAETPGSSGPEVAAEITTLSEQTRQWLDVHVLGFLMAEDLGRPPQIGLEKTAYIRIAAPQSRANITRAIRTGDLDIAPENITALCRLVAAEAFAVRQLQQQLASKEPKNQELKKSPLYVRYRDYLEQAPQIQQLAQDAANLAAFQKEQRNSKRN